jgi:protein phosphatase
MSPPGGPEVIGGLAERSQARVRSQEAGIPGPEGATNGDGDMGEGPDAGDGPPRGSIGAAVAAGDLAVGAAGAGTPGDLSPTTAQPEPGWLRRHWKGVSAAVAVTAVLLVGAVGFMWWLGSQWFVGADGQYVAIHQGIPQQVAGVPLHRVTTTTAVPVESLPYYDQALLDGTLDAATEAEARRIVTDLEAKSAACSSQEPPLGCPVGLAGAGAATTLPSASPTLTAPSPSPTGTLP